MSQRVLQAPLLAQVGRTDAATRKNPLERGEPLETDTVSHPNTNTQSCNANQWSATRLAAAGGFRVGRPMPAPLNECHERLPGVQSHSASRFVNKLGGEALRCDTTQRSTSCRRRAPPDPRRRRSFMDNNRLTRHQPLRLAAHTSCRAPGRAYPRGLCIWRRSLVVPATSPDCTGGTCLL